MSEYKSLLTANASDEMRALEAAIFRAFDQPAHILATLWNPHTCPLAFLPWLAWALSVDEWDAEWSEATKREVIAASLIIHLYKGTVGSIRRVLEVVGFPDAVITEWWETVLDPTIMWVHSTDPYTFSLGIDPQSNPTGFSPTTFARLNRLLAQNAPVRAHWCMYLNVKSLNLVAPVSVVRPVAVVRIASEI